MTFVHVSDVHLGANPEPTKSWSEKRALDIKESFSDVIEKCREVAADILLISGDLFNHQPVTSDLDYVNDLFKKIYNTDVYIVAGASDYIRDTSPILSYKFSDNVHYFFNKFPEVIENKKFGLAIYGFSYHSFEEKNSLIDSIHLKNDGLTHILLAYAGENRKCPIDINLLAKKDFTYCALGSKHNYSEIIDNHNAVYPGSLEPLSTEETGEHGIIIGDINEETHVIREHQFIKISRATYIPIKIKINVNTTISELMDIVTRDVYNKGINNIYDIEIEGFRDPDINITEDIFSSKIRISNFKDNSTPKYDFIKLSNEHPQDMIGAYIRKMLNNNQMELSEIEKKALFYGTHALIKSSDKGDN